MDDTREFSTSSIFDPSLWDDNEEFHARMKYEGRVTPFFEQSNGSNKLPVFLIGGPVLAILIVAVVTFPF